MSTSQIERECFALPRVVVKMAGLPKNTQWPVWAADNLFDETTVDLSQASLALGIDTSVEAFYYEAVRTLVASDVSPHFVLGYGTQHCAALHAWCAH